MALKDNALQSMIAALEQEIAKTRREGGGRAVGLRGGERIGQIPGGWQYNFPVDEGLFFRDDTPVKVVFADETVPGTIISFNDGILVVLLERDLGPNLSVVQLIADDSFLLERLKECLEKVNLGKLEVNLLSARKVFGLLPAKSGDGVPDPKVLSGEAGDRLNADQETAVRRSLGSEVTYLWGPPGTGKTLTLARVVEAHVREGCSVLLVSNTNAAVDTALERVADRLKNEPEFERGMVLRFGPIVRETLERQFGDQVSLSRVVERLSASLVAEKSELTVRIAKLESRERSLKRALEEVQRLEELQQTLIAVNELAQKLKLEIRQCESRLATVQEAIAQLHRKLQQAESMGSFRRLILGMFPERLRKQISDCEKQVHLINNQIEEKRRELNRNQAEASRIAAEVDQLRLVTEAYPSLTELRRGLSETDAHLTELRQRLASVEAQLAEVENRVIADCRVLATTVYRVYLYEHLTRAYDVVVIDEASMVIAPLVYYVASLARKAVVVAGDFRQLPPIVRSKSDLAREWLGKNVFEQARIPERLKSREPMPNLVALEVQYRMSDAICEVVNAFFYPDHPLKSSGNVEAELSNFPMGRDALLYVDTAAFSPWAAFQSGTHSRFNLLHALLIRSIAKYLAEDGGLSVDRHAIGRLGVVTPYAAQARLLTALLRDQMGDLARGTAGTVHRFQGNERDLIIVDLCDSTGVPLSRYYKATAVEDEGARLLNVAISRARRHVILVGNFDYIYAKAPEDAIVRGIVDHFVTKGKALEVDQVLRLDAQDWIDGLSRVFTHTFDLPESRSGIFSEANFYPAFRSDVRRARKSIVMLSPFITEHRTSQWFDLLRSAVERGMRVHIFVRPPNEFGGGDAREVANVISQFRSVGIEVTLRAGMHEKIYMLDGQIVWIGSMNVLSHNRSREVMMRIPSPALYTALTALLFSGVPPGESIPEEGYIDPPRCPICGGPMIWARGNRGDYFRCEDPDCGGTAGFTRSRATGSRRRRSGAATTDARNEASHRRSGRARSRLCPNCGKPLVERTGRYGRFLGCSNFPRCRYSEDL